MAAILSIVRTFCVTCITTWRPVGAECPVPSDQVSQSANKINERKKRFDRDARRLASRVPSWASLAVCLCSLIRRARASCCEYDARASCVSITAGGRAAVCAATVSGTTLLVWWILLTVNRDTGCRPYNHPRLVYAIFYHELRT